MINSEQLIKRWDETWKDVEDMDNEAKAAGTIIGRYIDEPIADGKAIYLITNEYKNKVKIKVVTGLGDDWRVPYWGDVATIDKDYALSKLKYRDSLAELFSKKKHT